MGVLALDNAIRANQTGWGTASDGVNAWAQVRGSMPFAVTSNKLTCNSASGGTFNVFRLGSLSSAALDLHVRVNPADTLDIGIVARYVSTTQYYYLILTGGNSLVIGSAPSFGTIGSASFSYSAGTAYWLHMLLVGSTLWGKVYADGSVEPANWNINGVSNSLYASGGFGLGSDSGSATNTQFDQFVATDTHLLICDGMGGVFS